MQLREPFDVQLVDQGLVPGAAARPIVTPGERRVDDRGQRRIRRAVPIVEREVVLPHAEAEQGVVPAGCPSDNLGVRIHDDLVGVEAVTLVGRIWAMDPIAVELARTNVGKIPVPHHIGVLRERDRQRFRVGIRRVEQAELDACRMLGKNREIHAHAVPGGAERRRQARPHSHRTIRHS
jgi:hypothetical protein